MRICILGAGALGSITGGYLAETGIDVTLIGRPAHVDAINKDGLQVVGRRGEFIIRDHLTAVSSAEQAEGDFDYLIILVKRKDTAASLQGADSLKNRVETVFSFQNGTGNEEELASWCGAEKVIGAVTVEGAEMISPGVVRNTLTADTTAYIGELDNTLSARVEVITDALNKAHFSTRAVTNIDQVEWEKAAQIGAASAWSVTNLAINPELTLGEGFSSREGAENYVTLATEILSVYTSMGYEPQNFFAPMSWNKQINEMDREQAIAFFQQIGKGMLEAGQKVRSSMHIDVLNGRITEIDYILGPYIAKAKESGISIPVAEYAYRIIQLQDKYAR
jgi:2-dehydropantoate 2-reductase